MRILSVLWFILFTVNGWSQAGSADTENVTVVALCTPRQIPAENRKMVNVDTPKVIVTGNCWGIIKQSPEPVLLQKGLTGKVTGLNVQSTAKGVFSDQRIVMRCYRVVRNDTSPMLIVDGVIKKLDTLSKINPNDISSIDILKSASATALFGPDGANGVIIITLKQLSFRKFCIKDFLDGSEIAGATVSFISNDKKDTLMFAANDSGFISTDKLKRSAVYEMRVSAIGYQLFSQLFNNSYGYKKLDVLLRREVKNCEEVILTSTLCPRRISCGFTLYCKCSGVTVTVNPAADEKLLPEPFKLKVYPSLVQRGSLINLRFMVDKEKIRTARIVSLGSTEMLRRELPIGKGSNQFQLSADARWAAGIYFAQLVCENGRVLASEKIIIQ